MHKPLITRPRLFLIGIVLLFFTLYEGQYFVKENNLACHLSETGDALSSAEDPSFSPKEKSIFFHETSCRGGLTIRQACAVEAAARAHPKQQIYVLFSAPVTDNELKTSCLAELLKITNVNFLRLHVAEYSKGTVVQSMLLNDVIHSTFRIQHTADILRMLTLNKWGGIYLDTDTIVTRSLENLPSNFVAKDNIVDIASAIMSFAKDEIGTNLTNAVIKFMSKDYDPTHWSIGPEAIEEVLHKLCPKIMDHPGFYTKPISNCKGIMIFNYELFYPQSYVNTDIIFGPAPRNFDLRRPYSYHMYDFLSQNRPIRKGTVYELVAKAFCPSIHTKYYYEFSAN